MGGRVGGVALVGLVVGSVLVVDPAGLAPFGPARFAVVSTATLAAAGLGLRRGGSLAKAPMLAWAAFLTLVAIAAVTGLDPLYAWLGTPERRFGALTWALCLLAFVAGQLLARPGADLALPATVVSVAVAGLWGLAEVLGWDPIALSGAGTRPVATLGSSAYLGAAMALLVPVAGGLALDPSRPTAHRRVAALGALVGGLALIASGARAAWVGALVAGAAVLVARRPRLPLRRAVPLALAGVVAAVSVAALTGVAGRVPDTFGDGDDSAGGIGGRLDEWRVASSVVAANPLTGVGPEGYRIAFGSHVDDAYQIEHGREPLPDRAHSAVLDVAATVGLPGLAAYLALLAVVGRFVVRALRRGPPWLAGVAAGLLGYAVQSAFLFPLAELDPLAWALAGVVVAAVAAPDASVTSRPAWAAPVALAVLAVVALVAGGLDVVADRRARQSLLALTSSVAPPAAPASELRPDALRYRLVDSRVHQAPGTVAGLQAALGDLDAALDLSPLDPVARTERARLLLELARTTEDPADLRAAREALEHLAEDDPRNAEVLLRLGLARSLAGDDPGAEAAWLAAERLAPGSGAASTNLAVAYARAGRRADAVAAAQRALARDPSNQRAAAVLADLGT